MQGRQGDPLNPEDLRISLSAGWRGYDPTNNKLAGSEHVSVAVAREQEKASPLSGSWEGPADAFERMEVSVQVVAL